MNKSLIQEEVDEPSRVNADFILLYFFYCFRTTVAPRVFDEGGDGDGAAGNASEAISSKFNS